MSESVPITPDIIAQGLGYKSASSLKSAMRAEAGVVTPTNTTNTTAAGSNVVRRNHSHEAKYGDSKRILSKLDADPYTFASVTYPRDVTSNMQNGHYMLFYVNVQEKTKYNHQAYDTRGNSMKLGGKVTHTGISPHGDAPVTTVVTDATDPEYRRKFSEVKGGKPGSIITSDDIDLRKQSRSGEGKGTGMSSYRNTTRRITDSVAIYLPPNVQNNTSASYNGIEQGALGLAAAGGGQFLNAMSRNDFAKAAEILVGTGGNIIGAGLQKALAGAADLFFDTEGASDLYNKAFGNATNPYMEVFFGGMQLREFTYNFTFAPKNIEERDDVQAIIQLFRFHMAPELQGENMRYLTLPATFDIHYMYQTSADRAFENPFYNKIATCVLTNVAVDYTPNGVKSFSDGSPTQITMGLSFQETELMTKERIDEGF